jgi:hypothetical protein
MGLLDFLNPKKAIEKKLSQTVERTLGPGLGELRNISDPGARRATLTRMVEDQLRRQANNVIPSALQKHSHGIVQSVSRNLVTKLEQQLAT